MSAHVIMDDGTEADLIEHLSQDHRKGTRGYTAEYLARMHANLHQGKNSMPTEHSHLAAMDEAAG